MSESPQRQKAVLCFGDSNTHGSLPMEFDGDKRRLGPAERWPGIASQALGPEWKIIEDGLPGRTTVHDDPIEGAHKNGLTGLRIALESHRPIDLVVIKLGTNDLKTRYAVSALDIAKSVEQLVMMVKAAIDPETNRACEVLLVAPPPIAETGWFEQMFLGGAAKSAQFGVQYAEVADRQDCGFLDAGTIIRSSPVDGIHFDADEHLKLGLAIAQRIGRFAE